MCLMNNQLTRKQELAASRVDELLRLQLMNEERCREMITASSFQIS